MTETGKPADKTSEGPASPSFRDYGGKRNDRAANMDGISASDEGENGYDEVHTARRRLVGESFVLDEDARRRRKSRAKGNEGDDIPIMSRNGWDR